MLQYQIIKLDQVDSTNNYLKDLITNNKINEGVVVYCNNQLQGRGQRGNTWLSEPNKNLTFSTIFYTSFIAASQQFMITKSIALGIYDYLLNLTDNVKIKWPNDIYVGNQKIAGILIENTLKQDHLLNSIIGIGLNVNQQIFESSINHATSVSLVCYQDFNLEVVLDDLLKCIGKRYLELRNLKWKKIDLDYLEALYLKDELANFENPAGEIFIGTIRGVSQSGALMIEHQNKEILYYNFKEISFVLK